MRPERLQSLAARGVALDTETHRLRRGMLCPPLVCGSVGWLAPGPRIEGALVDKRGALEAFARALDDDSIILIGANIAYDIGVIATEFARMGVDAMPRFFAALEAGRVYDLQIAEALNAIALGQLGKDPRTGADLKNPETGKRGSYSLSMCVSLTLGREDAKANDEWRERYDELEHVPIELWPPAARDYPVDDARNTAEVALAQTGHFPKISTRHEWANFEREDGTTFNACADCGATKFTAACTTRRPHLNLHQVADQTYSAVALHLGAAHGFRVDQAAVDVIERHALRRRAKLIQPFIDAGIVWVDEDGYHEDQSKLKRLLVLAYGATEPCPHCAGTGKIPSPKSTLQCPECRGRCAPWKSRGQVMQPTVATCARCKSTGRIPHPNPKMINCVIKSSGGAAGDDDDDDDEVGQVTCDGSGYVIPHGVPRAEKGGIAKGRDQLVESGDEFLMSYAGYLEDAKILKDYVPYLRLAREPIAGHAPTCPSLKAEKGKKTPACTCPGPYRDIPLTLRPNVVLETGRVSYGGYIQLFPRRPGFLDEETREYVPSLRECIVPRGPCYEIVEVPDDYVLQAGEFVAQGVGAC